MGTPYTDLETWTILFERQEKLWENYACQEYIQGIRNLGLTSNELGSIKKVDSVLQELNGWKLIPVDGALSPKDYLTLMSNKKHPIAYQMRPKEQLDHAKAPDLFHDLVGHIPLLTNHAFSSFLERYAQISLPWVDHESILDGLSRFYKWTTEFGLIKENSKDLFFGAGILSSKGEIEYILGGAPSILDFQVKRLFNTHHTYGDLQSQYFVINSFDQLFDSIEEITSYITFLSNNN